jgi:aminopeptidase N
MAAREYLDLVLRHGRRETQIGALERALTQASLAIDLYSEPAHREAAGRRLARAALEQLRQAKPGSDHQLAWARAFVNKARSDEHRVTVRGLLDGSVTFDGLAVDTDFRWQLVVALAAAGEKDAEGLVRAELDRDPTDKGQRNAFSAQAAVPTEEAKESAWRLLVEDRTLSHAVLDSIMHGFQQAGQDELLEPYARRYFEVLPRVWEERDLEVALDFGERMYPRWIVSDRTAEMTDAYLRREGLPGPIRRLLVEGRDRLLRAQRARRADAAAGRAGA